MEEYLDTMVAMVDHRGEAFDMVILLVITVEMVDHKVEAFDVAIPLATTTEMVGLKDVAGGMVNELA